MKIFKVNVIAAVVLTLSHLNAHAEWSDIFNSVVNQAGEKSGADLAQSALSNSEVVAGLKEALAKGVESSINTLGTSGGFLNNSAVKIAVPDSLTTIAATARTLGQGQYVDSLEATMNHAAEQAVPEAASILSEAIRQMSVKDAMSILNGPENSATRYFRKVSEASLQRKFKPIVSDATEKVGVTASYKQLTAQATPLLGGLLDSSALDIDQYVTDKALDGLFKYIAAEEKSIRTNPAARTTDILKKVFN